MTKKATKIEDVETLHARLAEMREAQAEFATFSQEQVDKIFYEAALAAEKARVPLARMAVEETGMGVMEDKVIKNHYAAEYIFNKYKHMKTCGVVEEDKAGGYKVVAEPMGIVAAVIPTTQAAQRHPHLAAPARKGLHHGGCPHCSRCCREGRLPQGHYRLGAKPNH